VAFRQLKRSSRDGVFGNLPTPSVARGIYRKCDLNEAAKAADACASLSEQQLF